jgi:hypothetical protein
MAVGLSIPCLSQSHISASDGENPCAVGWAEPPRVDPRNPDIICLPELGRMEGTLLKAKIPGNGEEFGKSIAPLPDIDHDGLADWIVAHNRIDTIAPADYLLHPTELLLYRGVKGGLPSVNSGERIGPAEIGSSTSFLAAGDFDNDGNVDLVCRFEVYRDSSFQRPTTQVSTVVVLWGTAQGRFSLNDTTRLSCGADGWYGPYGAVATDFDHNGINDLFVWGFVGKGVTSGQVVMVPKLFLYRGHNGRWGHDGIANIADWQVWNAPVCTRVGLEDQDGDSNDDVVFYDNADAGTGHVSLLYGRQEALPDSNDIETVDLKVSNGHYSIFSDVTGDHVPELIMTAGTENKLKVFVGLKGQRLKEQYGPGHASLDTASNHWWKRPWAELWQPNKINDGWFATEDNQLFDLGDATGDGISEIWSMSRPFILIYSTGSQQSRLDSLIDAMVDTRPGSGPSLGGIQRLGDIDGSGRTTLTINYDQLPHDYQHPFPGGIKFVQSSGDIPANGRYRQLPDGTGPASVEAGRQNPADALLLKAVPNPASGQMQLQWSGINLTGDAVITISDEDGHEIGRYITSALPAEFTFPLEGYAVGTYFVTITLGQRTATTIVVVR